MTTITYFDAPAPRPGFFAALWRFFFQSDTPSVRARPRKPVFAPKFGDVDAREKPKRPEPERQVEPVAVSVDLVDLVQLEAELMRRDRLADLKQQLRSLTYGEMMEAAAGLGFDPKIAWAWATAAPAANVVPMRMAA